MAASRVGNRVAFGTVWRGWRAPFIHAARILDAQAWIRIRAKIRADWRGLSRKSHNILHYAYLGIH